MTSSSPPAGIGFGEFRFFPAQRRLERAGAVVDLSGRASDLLAALVERAGEVLSKRELMARVWPDTVVVDAALRFHMAALRRALGDGQGGARFIATVAGRGYAFVAEVEVQPAQAEAVASPASPGGAHPLPPAPARVVGREAVIEELLSGLQAQRFLTIVGPGGIGKTTVALLAAHRWAAAHGETTVFVDLGELALDDEESVAEALCAALGVAPQAATPLERALAHLEARRALIVLDTCEGVIEAAARVAESLVASAPGVSVLATSRETLRAEGELVYRIEPLAAPPPGAELTAQEALAYPAVQLFAERVAAKNAGYEFSDQRISIAASICRDLDGMALAIELAAGRVEALGVQKVAELLSTEFALTWPGRRTAVPRQQTLIATLNWSHELLGPSERKVFRRLSVLGGAPFSLESAMAVCGDAETPQSEVVEALFSLVAKSLVRAVVDEVHRRYRLLDIARTYAHSKLEASGEEPEVRQRQARYYMGLLKSPAEHPAVTSECVANVRGVLTWAFATEGMDGLAIELSAAAASLWPRAGLLADSRRWTREALARLDGGATVGDELEARTALAGSLMYTHGITADSYRNLEIVYRQTQFEGRSDLRLAGLAVLWGHQIRLARFGAAQRLLDESGFLEAVKGDATVTAAFHWMAATTCNYRGDDKAALMHAARVVGERTEAASDLMRRLFGYDLEVGALRLFSLSHFYLGEVEEALALRARALERATALSYVAPLANTLYWQAFMAYLLEQTEEVERLTTSIIEPERPNTSLPTAGWAMSIQGLSLMRRGEVDRGREMVRLGLGICQDAEFLMMDAFIRAELALLQARQRSPAKAWEAAPSLPGEPDEECWSSPEVLRIRGEIAELNGDTAVAEARYLDALALAERRGALFWRVRAATSLASLRLGQGRAEEAEAALAPAYEACSSGAWPDLRRAAACLEACRRAAAPAQPVGPGRDGLADAVTRSGERGRAGRGSSAPGDRP